MLAVFVEPPVAPEPREGPLYDPSSRQQDEALSIAGALYDFEFRGSLADQSVTKFVARISSVSEELLQPRETAAQAFERDRSGVPILHVGGVDGGGDEVTFSVDDDLALATLDFLSPLPGR